MLLCNRTSPPFRFHNMACSQLLVSRSVVQDRLHFKGNRALHRLCSSAQRELNGNASSRRAPINDGLMSSRLALSLLCHPMQTAQGQYMMAMANKSLPLGLIAQAASQKLELILAEASSSSYACVGAHQETLQRRIEEAKEKKRRKAVQEIIYVLVASRMLYAMLARPQEHTCTHPDPGPMLTISELLIQQELDTMIMSVQQPGHSDGLDGRLQAIHAPEVQGLAARHVAMVIYGKGRRALSVPLELNALAHVDRLEMGKMYAASVMHGYFLARLHQRFQLDRRLHVSTSSIGASMQREHVVPASLEAYMDGHAFQDRETLCQMSRISSSTTLQVIEHHCAALFADMSPVQSQTRGPLQSHDDKNLSVHLSFVRSLIYQALAFGALLWDVEHNLAPLYPLICNEH